MTYPKHDTVTWYPFFTLSIVKLLRNIFFPLRNIFFLLRNTFFSRKRMEKNHYLTSSIQIQSDGLTLLNHSHLCPDSISKRSVLEGFHKCHAQSTSAAYTVASMTDWYHVIVLGVICTNINFHIRYIFARNCFETGLMTETEWAIYQEWSTYLLNSLGELQLDGFIYLRADPATCAGRMAKRGRPEEQGVTIDYLNQLHDKHEAWLHKREFRFVSSMFRIFWFYESDLPKNRLIEIF